MVKSFMRLWRPTFKYGLRVPPFVRVRRPRPGRDRRTVGDRAASRQRRIEPATDHIAVITAALAQIPGGRAGKSVLVRIDGAGSTHKVIDWLTRRRLAYSVGFTLPENTPDLLRRIPQVWTEAYDAHGQIRDGAWVAELTNLMDLSSWPAGMRVIVRKERPHPGAQLRFEDVEGMRITAFANNTPRGQLSDLELRHRRRARCEDRIGSPRTPALPTRPWPPSRRTRSGAPSWPWPLRSPPGCRCSLSPAPTQARRPTPRAGGSPTGCATGSSPSGHPRSDRATDLAAPVRPITVGRADPDRTGPPGRPRPRLSRPPPSPRSPRGPRPWNRRPTRTTPGPPVTPGRHNHVRRQQNCPQPPPWPHRESSRLAPARTMVVYQACWSPAQAASGAVCAPYISDLSETSCRHCC
jgi:hypothetical protein